MGFHDILMNRSVSTEDDRGLTSYSTSSALMQSLTVKAGLLYRRGAKIEGITLQGRVKGGRKPLLCSKDIRNLDRITQEEGFEA
jgi:hypothetical protein